RSFNRWRNGTCPSSSSAVLRYSEPCSMTNSCKLSLRGGLGLRLLFCCGLTWAGTPAAWAAESRSLPAGHAAGLTQPIAVYNNWSAYDELSDNIELTEQLALKELGGILRL